MKVINRLFWSFLIIFCFTWLPYLLQFRARVMFLEKNETHFTTYFAEYLAGLFVAIIWILDLVVALLVIFIVLTLFCRWTVWIGTGKWGVTKFEEFFGM